MMHKWGICYQKDQHKMKKMGLTVEEVFMATH